MSDFVKGQIGKEEARAVFVGPLFGDLDPSRFGGGVGAGCQELGVKAVGSRGMDHSF